MPVHLNIKLKAAVYHPRNSDLECAHFLLTFETDNCLHATDPRCIHCYSESRRVHPINRVAATCTRCVTNFRNVAG